MTAGLRVRGDLRACIGVCNDTGLNDCAPLGVDQEVEEGIHGVELIVGHVAHGLLAHGALVGVAGGLVVVRVGDQAGHHPQHCEGLYLQMRRLRPCMHEQFWLQQLDDGPIIDYKVSTSWYGEHMKGMCEHSR